MTRKSESLLLFDANVIIHLFKLHIWETVIARRDVCLGGIVVSEAHFYETDEGERIDFDLSDYVNAGQVQRFDVLVSETQTFCAKFTPLFSDQIHAGELELLVRLSENPSEYHLCSSDAIVFRVLGALDLSEKGLSLEEVLSQTGLGRALPHQFSRKFRERWTQKGFQEGLRGLGLKDSPLT